MTTFIYVGSLILQILTMFLKDATSSNWNIADSGTARKSDMVHTPAVHRSMNTQNETCRDDKAYELYCKAYRTNDFCKKYPYGMDKHCPLTCGFCTSASLLVKEADSSFQHFSNSYTLKDEYYHCCGNNECKAKIDIGFLVDSSGSIEKSGKGNYKKCLDFIKTAVNGSFISETFTHVGLVLFSSKRQTVFTLTQFYEAEPMMKAIDKAPYLKGGTLTGKALNYAKAELFDKTGRKDVPKVLIVMTDGKSTDDVIVPANIMSAANITVFAIGVGRNYDIQQLQQIASKPEIKYALTSDFNRLNDLYTSIRDDACRVNSTLSDQGVLLNTPVHTPAHDHASFAPHGSHTMVPQIAVLKSKSKIEEHPHKHTRG